MNEQQMNEAQLRMFAVDQATKLIGQANFKSAAEVVEAAAAIYAFVKGEGK